MDIRLDRQGKPTEYIKTIGIKAKKLSIIDSIRGKKSKAGKLDEIIEFYLKEKNLTIIQVDHHHTKTYLGNSIR